MRLLFIDTEFNGFGGALISMGIVDQYGHEFYEVLPVRAQLNEWVRDNVMTVIGKDAVPFQDFQKKLEAYLNYSAEDFTIIADWPDDLRYFMQSLIVSPGVMMNVPSFDARMDRRLSSEDSEIPHNALEDAKAIQRAWFDLTNA